MAFEKQDMVISKLTWKNKLRTFLSENLENQSWRNFEYQQTVSKSQNQMVPNHSKKQKNNQKLSSFYRWRQDTLQSGFGCYKKGWKKSIKRFINFIKIKN